MYKNVSGQKVAVFAWDNAAGSAKTGDAANISAQISKDGAACAATNDVAPTELDAADAPGVYIFDILQAETNADLIVITPVSSTTDIVLRPVIIYVTTKTGYALSAAGIDGILDEVFEGALTVRQGLRLFLSVLAGKSAGGGGVTITMRDNADSKNRITATVDANGNRTAMTLDGA